MFTFELESGLGSASVSISRDGEIRFDDPHTLEALEYDTAMQEFGDRVSALLGFFRSTKWNYYVAPLHQVLIFGDMDFESKEISLPWAVTAWHTSIPDHLESQEECISALLLLDYLEHVVPIYEEQHPRSFVLRRAIDIARKFVVTQRRALKEHRFDSWLQTIQYAGLKTVAERSWRAVEDIYRKSDPFNSDTGVVIAVATHADWAWRHAGRNAEYARIRDSAGAAAGAVGHSVNANVLSNEYAAAVNTERRWQIRRFAHVMAALRSGKRYPPLKATR